MFDHPKDTTPVPLRSSAPRAPVPLSDDAPLVSLGGALLLTVTEAAAALRLSRAQTYVLISRGDLEAVKIGTRLISACVPPTSSHGTQML